MIRTEILYDKIGKGYNRTRIADTYITQKLLTLLLANKDKLYVEIGCGTGNYAISLSDSGIKFYGVDPSQNMLEAARQKSNSVKWLTGSADNIPVEDNYFDGGIAILTIHHWPNLKSAFLELSRILKIHSQMVIFTSLPEQMNYYWLNHYFPKMMADSAKRMPTLDSIENAAKTGGFNIISTEKYDVQPDLQDHFLYSGKSNPSIYLEDSIRKGISSFADIANKDEIKIGLKKLKEDIDRKYFFKVKDKFENDLGDYLFITLRN